MAAWHFSGGAKIFTSAMGVHVTGSGALADRARTLLKIHDLGEPIRVTIHGAGSLPWSPSSAWLTDRWCGELAQRMRETVTTDYQPSAHDVPSAALEILAKEPEPEGAVH